MVNDNEQSDVELDVTNDEHSEVEDIELEDIESREDNKMKKLREKLKAAVEDKQKLQDEVQRAKADFLNARKRLEEERVRDRIRYKKQFVEDLLPLCDSFQMAMQNTEAWEKADASWRKGVEGIHTQLLNVLREYGVSGINPVGERFDPSRHEAVGTEPVADKTKDDTVVSVLQNGYEITYDGTTEIIRPARVTTGTYSE